MKYERLSEEVIKRLPPPPAGNRITYFAEATIQGARAPRGFGVRVTAFGARAFVLNYRLRGREYRYTIGAWPGRHCAQTVREARHLRQRVDRGEDSLEDRASPSTATTVGPFWTSSCFAMSATATSHYAAPMNMKVRSGAL